MKLIETEGIVLKTYALGDADKIVLILTRQEGLRRLTVRGAKKLKSRFTGSLEPYTILNLIYSQKDEADLGKLFEAQLIESHFHLARQLETQIALAYASELLIAATPPHEPNEKLYRMLRACLQSIDLTSHDFEAVKAIVLYFEIWLLRLGGFLPSFKKCAQCQRALKRQSIYFQPDSSQFVCGDCASQSLWREIAVGSLINVLEKALAFPPAEFADVARRAATQLPSLQKIIHTLLSKALEYNPQDWSNEVFVHAESQIKNSLKVEQIGA